MIQEQNVNQDFKHLDQTHVEIELFDNSIERLIPSKKLDHLEQP